MNDSVACLSLLTHTVLSYPGFNTAKGDMVRSILYPKPMNFKLYRDAFRFLMCLVSIAIIGFIYSVVVFAVKGGSARDIVVKSLVAVTVAIPPVLPAAVATGIMYAQKRLKKKKIFCISPQRINVCGRINLVCFDKTGTLTEDGLDLWGVVPCSESRSEPWGKLNMLSLLPVDGLTILQQFPFSSSLQRMSVVSQVIESGEHLVFLKGAPEMVIRFCHPESVPEDFYDELQQYTLQGFRVIGLAYKKIRQTKDLSTESYTR
ncbi:hypothetical protein AB205_0172530 [Aquarana catesbeiana]|uniref:Cation-transporting P-type ATPase N-terminal domain-containing protein n=1 Tax=Aquarana catesbeiana TaxID=8400 RepID=A0A2G9NMI7_AQUCT|nr:hypothetical protein AB205_0172530 [Aquarana catesbeiana]